MAFLENHPEATITSGSVLPVEWFHEDASPQEWRRFGNLVKTGRWELTAGWAHMNTAMLSEAEGRRFFLAARRWEDEFGVSIKVWHHADVPGIGWNMAEAATDANLDLIAVGANELGGLSPLPDLPRLFNWEAPDGEMITVSLHGGSGYMEGGLDLKIHVLDGLEGRLKQFEKELADKNYPLDIAMVLFSSGDNTGPQVFNQLIETVEKWNSTGKSPKLKISRFSDFNKAIEKDRHKLPKVRQDWPASWEALVRRAPRGESQVRAAQRGILAAEALSVVTDMPDRAAIALAWRNILLHDEHSGTGVWPGKLTLEQALEQNRTEYLYAADAGAQTETLVNEGLESLKSSIKGPQKGRLLVFNPTSTAKTLAGLNDEDDYIESPEINGIGYRVEGRSIKKEKRHPPDFWQLQTDPESPSSLHTRTSIYKHVFRKLRSIKLLLNLDTNEVSKTTDFYATHKLKSGYAPSGFMRAGIWISPEVSKARDKAWLYTGEGILLRRKGLGKSLLVTSVDGTPFRTAGETLQSLLYIMEPPYTFKGGETGYIGPEPDAPGQINSRYIISESHGIRDDIEAVRNFGKNSSPAVAAVMEGEGQGGDLPSSGGVFIGTDNPSIWITELKRADFGEGAIVVLRNVTGLRITVGLRSDFLDFTGVAIVDGMERNTPGGDIYCTDQTNHSADCRSGKDLKPYVVMRPYEAVELRITVTEH